MLNAHVDEDYGVVGRYGCSGTQSRLHQSGSTGASTTGTGRGATRSCAGGSGAETADTTAGSPLHDTGVNSTE